MVKCKKRLSRMYGIHAPLGCVNVIVQCLSAPTMGETDAL